MKHQVSIIIPNYNGYDLLKKNLPSVINAGLNKDNSICEIIIVDDASIDNSVIFLKKYFPSVKIIKHSKNRGFSSSINTGVRTAKGSLVALLNSDVTVSVDFLTSVIPLFEDDLLFAVSLHEKGYGSSKGLFKDGFVVHDGQKEEKQVQNTFWVSGGSGVFRRDLFNKFGGMDEELLSPFYWEDIDLSYRAQKRGYKLLWNPDSLVIHNHESTTSRISKRKRSRIQERNQLLFIWKNITSNVYIRKHISGLFGRMIRHPGYSVIFIMALKNILIVLKKRKKEKRECKVSDEAIFSKYK